MSWDGSVVGLWKVGMNNLTMHTHSAFDTFYDYFYYVSNSILFMVLACKYSFEHVFVNISLVDYDLPATVF